MHKKKITKKVKISIWYARINQIWAYLVYIHVELT